jgi:hypothetical protein
MSYLLSVAAALIAIGLLNFTAHPLEWALLIALGIGVSAFIVLRAR